MAIISKKKIKFQQKNLTNQIIYILHLKLGMSQCQLILYNKKKLLSKSKREISKSKHGVYESMKKEKHTMY